MKVSNLLDHPVYIQCISVYMCVTTYTEISLVDENLRYFYCPDSFVFAAMTSYLKILTQSNYCFIAVIILSNRSGLNNKDNT